MTLFGINLDECCNKCGRYYIVTILDSGGERKDCPKCDWDNVPPRVKDKHPEIDETK